MSGDAKNRPPERLLKGQLYPFAETGSEGTHWVFIEDEKPHHKDIWDRTHALEQGDVLRVFNDAARKEELWQGRVDMDYQACRRSLPLAPHLVYQYLDSIGTVHGLQKGVDPEAWARFFIDEKPAILIKKTVKSPSP